MHEPVAPSSDGLIHAATVSAREDGSIGSLMPIDRNASIAAMSVFSSDAFAIHDSRIVYNWTMLKPQDVLVVIKIALLGRPDWTYATLASELFLSASGVHESVQRAAKSDLINLENRSVKLEPLLEFLIHGVRYSFPPEYGKIAHGMATAFGAEVAKRYLTVAAGETIPVWPGRLGDSRGITMKPLHKSVPVAAARDQRLYDVMAFIDMVRSGKARERRVAAEQITSRLAARVSTS